MITLQSVWGWQPSLYLFLGGMGSGAFAVLSVLFLRNGFAVRKTANVSAWCAFACLAVGLLCLITELTNPLRGLLLWQSFSNLGSWMAVGAWLLVGAMGSLFLFCVLSSGLAPRLAKKGEGGAIPDAPFARTLRVLSVMGIIFGLGVAAYTGILLMSAPGVPLWNTALLPCLFTVSGLDTGVALVEIASYIMAKRECLPLTEVRLLEKLVLALVLVEAAVLAIFLVQGANAGAGSLLAGDAAATRAISTELLLSGQLSKAFWVLVVCLGLGMPFLGAIIGLARSSAALAEGDTVSANASRVGVPTLLCALCALIGGCALRFIMVMAGIHADPVTGTVTQLFADLVARL